MNHGASSLLSQELLALRKTYPRAFHQSASSVEEAVFSGWNTIWGDGSPENLPSFKMIQALITEGKVALAYELVTERDKYTLSLNPREAISAIAILLQSPLLSKDQRQNLDSSAQTYCAYYFQNMTDFEKTLCFQTPNAPLLANTLYTASADPVEIRWMKIAVDYKNIDFLACVLLGRKDFEYRGNNGLQSFSHENVLVLFKQMLRSSQTSQEEKEQIFDKIQRYCEFDLKNIETVWDRLFNQNPLAPEYQELLIETLLLMLQKSLSTCDSKHPDYAANLEKYQKAVSFLKEKTENEAHLAILRQIEKDCKSKILENNADRSFQSLLNSCKALTTSKEATKKPDIAKDISNCIRTRIAIQKYDGMPDEQRKLLLDKQDASFMAALSLLAQYVSTAKTPDCIATAEEIYQSFFKFSQEGAPSSEYTKLLDAIQVSLLQKRAEIVLNNLKIFPVEAESSHSVGELKSAATQYQQYVRSLKGEEIAQSVIASQIQDLNNKFTQKFATHYSTKLDKEVKLLDHSSGDRDALNQIVAKIDRHFQTYLTESSTLLLEFAKTPAIEESDALLLDIVKKLNHGNGAQLYSERSHARWFIAKNILNQSPCRATLLPILEEALGAKEVCSWCHSSSSNQTILQLAQGSNIDSKVLHVVLKAYTRQYTAASTQQQKSFDTTFQKGFHRSFDSVPFIHLLIRQQMWDEVAEIIRCDSSCLSKRSPDGSKTVIQALSESAPKNVIVAILSQIADEGNQEKSNSLRDLLKKDEQVFIDCLMLGLPPTPSAETDRQDEEIKRLSMQLFHKYGKDCPQDIKNQALNLALASKSLQAISLAIQVGGVFTSAPALIQGLDIAIQELSEIQAERTERKASPKRPLSPSGETDRDDDSSFSDSGSEVSDESETGAEAAVKASELELNTILSALYDSEKLKSCSAESEDIQTMVARFLESLKSSEPKSLEFKTYKLFLTRWAKAHPLVEYRVGGEGASLLEIALQNRKIWPEDDIKAMLAAKKKASQPSSRLTKSDRRVCALLAQKTENNKDVAIRILESYASHSDGFSIMVDNPDSLGSPSQIPLWKWSILQGEIRVLSPFLKHSYLNDGENFKELNSFLQDRIQRSLSGETTAMTSENVRMSLEAIWKTKDINEESVQDFAKAALSCMSETMLEKLLTALNAAPTVLSHEIIRECKKLLQEKLEKMDSMREDSKGAFHQKLFEYNTQISREEFFLELKSGCGNNDRALKILSDTKHYQWTVEWINAYVKQATDSSSSVPVDRVAFLLSLAVQCVRPSEGSGDPVLDFQSIQVFIIKENKVSRDKDLSQAPDLSGILTKAIAQENSALIKCLFLYDPSLTLPKANEENRGQTALDFLYADLVNAIDKYEKLVLPNEADTETLYKKVLFFKKFLGDFSTIQAGDVESLGMPAFFRYKARTVLYDSEFARLNIDDSDKEFLLTTAIASIKASQDFESHAKKTEERGSSLYILKAIFQLQRAGKVTTSGVSGVSLSYLIQEYKINQDIREQVDRIQRNNDSYTPTANTDPDWQKKQGFAKRVFDLGPDSPLLNNPVCQKILRKIAEESIAQGLPWCGQGMASLEGKADSEIPDIWKHEIALYQSCADSTPSKDSNESLGPLLIQSRAFSLLKETIETMSQEEIQSLGLFASELVSAAQDPNVSYQDFKTIIESLYLLKEKGIDIKNQESAGTSSSVARDIERNHPDRATEKTKFLAQCLQYNPDSEKSWYASWKKASTWRNVGIMTLGLVLGVLPALIYGSIVYASYRTHKDSMKQEVVSQSAYTAWQPKQVAAPVSDSAYVSESDADSDSLDHGKARAQPGFPPVPGLFADAAMANQKEPDCHTPGSNL